MLHSECSIELGEEMFLHTKRMKALVPLVRPKMVCDVASLARKPPFGLLGPPTYIYNVRSLLRMNKRHEATTGVPNGHAGTV
jgi:hypothetical protein